MKLLQSIEISILQNLSDDTEFVSPVIYNTSKDTCSVQIIESL